MSGLYNPPLTFICKLEKKREFIQKSHLNIEKWKA